MRKNVFPIIRIIMFIILFAYMYQYVTYLMRPEGHNINNITGFYGEKENSLDMVYMGGSATFVYYMPLKSWQDHGFTSYDYAANSIMPEIYITMLKEIQKTQNPKLIIIDARAFEYRDRYIETGLLEPSYRNVLTYLPYSKERFNAINEIVPKYMNQDPLTWHLDVMKFHGMYEELLYRRAFELLTGTYKNERKGFQFIPTWQKLEKPDFYTDNVTPVSKETEGILIDLLEFIKTTPDTKYLFVVSPYGQTVKQKAILNYVENIIENSGNTFVDFNEYYDEMGINFNEDFYNISHTNVFGAEKYTDFLNEYLIRNYDFEDNRGKSTHKDWDKVMTWWNKKVETEKLKTIKYKLEKENGLLGIE